MTDPFAAYGAKATSTAKDRLVGPTKTRAGLRELYALVETELRAANSKAALAACLEAHNSTIIQVHAEAPLLWSGDGAEFRGLEKEIEHAAARVDDGLDFPRWEPSDPTVSAVI